MMSRLSSRFPCSTPILTRMLTRMFKTGFDPGFAIEIVNLNVVALRREKQIAYGKNTVDYDKYTELVKRAERKDRMPRTPNKNKKYSRRQWDGLVKNWKQQIHSTVNQLEGLEEVGFLPFLI